MPVGIKLSEINFTQFNCYPNFPLFRNLTHYLLVDLFAVDYTTHKYFFQHSLSQ